MAIIELRPRSIPRAAGHGEERKGERDDASKIT
jgi:hypothetical protein